MTDSKILSKLKKDEKFSNVLTSLIANPQALRFADKSYILSCAIVFIREYESNPSFTSLLELGYYIILK